MDDSPEGENRPSEPPNNREKILRDYIPHPYLGLNADGEIIAVNDAVVDLLGREREEVIGNWFGTFLSDNSSKKFEETFPTVKKRGHISGIEFKLLPADDSTLFVSFDGQAEFDEAGDIVRIHCQINDVTERKQYETFIQNSPDIILLHDETGEAKYVSPAVEQEMGYDPDSLTGRNPFDDIHPDDRDRMWEAFSRILSNPGEVGTEEYRIQDADGAYVWVESRAKNLRDEEGLTGLLINSRVIDERKEHENELQRQNERLDEFTSVVSHDLRNPLNVAIGQLDLAQEECDSERLDAAASAVERSLDLIEGMLELARSGQRVSDKEAVDLAVLARAAWANVETSDAEILVDTESTIQADKDRLAQLLENIFRNALEQGGETITVGVLADGFYIEDDGPGIPEENRERIFQAGYSTRDEGTGLGLSIVKEIIEAHDWDIRVTEGAQGGARFEITGVEFTAE